MGGALKNMRRVSIFDFVYLKAESNASLLTNTEDSAVELGVARRCRYLGLVFLYRARHRSLSDPIIPVQSDRTTEAKQPEQEFRRELVRTELIASQVQSRQLPPIAASANWGKSVKREKY